MTGVNVGKIYFRVLDASWLVWFSMSFLLLFLTDNGRETFGEHADEVFESVFPHVSIAYASSQLLRTKKKQKREKAPQSSRSNLTGRLRV